MAFSLRIFAIIALTAFASTACKIAVTSAHHTLKPRTKLPERNEQGVICVAVSEPVSSYTRGHATSPFDKIVLPVGLTLVEYFQDRTRQLDYVRLVPDLASGADCRAVVRIDSLGATTRRNMALYDDGSVSFQASIDVTVRVDSVDSKFRLQTDLEKAWPNRAYAPAYFQGIAGAGEIIAAQGREADALAAVMDSHMIMLTDEIVKLAVRQCRTGPAAVGAPSAANSSAAGKAGTVCAPGHEIFCVGDELCVGKELCVADGSGYQPCTCHPDLNPTEGSAQAGGAEAEQLGRLSDAFFSADPKNRARGIVQAVAKDQKTALPKLGLMATGDTDEGVRRLACWAIGELGTSSDIQVLKTVIAKDTSALVKHEAMVAVASIEGKSGAH